ncbi:cytochrome P450 [Trichophaea hybrida]|nr:cytochrome P450 [Trichophaea hybrida]
MGLASLLPSFLQFIAAMNINKDFKTIRKILIPVIQRRRLALPTKNDLIFFLDFILDAVPDDTRAADLVAVIVFGGLTNLQSTFSSTVLDILNIPSLQSTLLPSLSQASASNINVFSPPPQSSPWSPLRAAMFESIRLCGPITGPARIIASPTTLSSDPKLHLPKGQAATLSSFYTHRDPEMWGANAACYKYDRFVEGDPPIGMPEYIPWGLKGPHTCPGRWFAMTTIQVMTKELLVAYDFVQDFVVKEEEKYIYSAGNVKRLEVGVEVTRRV